MINPSGGTAIAPTIGATLNGHQTVQFSRGSQEYLVPTTPLSPNPLAPETGGSPLQQKSFWYVFNWTADVSANGPTAGYDNSALFCDLQNRINIAFRSGKSQVCIFDNAFKGTEVAYTNSTWAIGMVLIDGVNVSIRIGNGVFTSTACGFLASSGGAVQIGRSSDNVALFGGRIASFGMADSLWDAPTCAAIYARLASDWGL